METYALAAREEEVFGAARRKFDELTQQLGSVEWLGMTHAEVEGHLQVQGWELLRQLYQDHLALRAEREVVLEEVNGSDGVERTHRREQERALMSVFGPVRVPRMGYGGRGMASLMPLDAQLNLPQEEYSHGVRRRVAEEVARGAYEEATAALARSTGAQVPKRQAEQLAMRAAQDFEAFYQSRRAASAAEEAKTGELVVLTGDGKGVPMRKKYLRQATRKAAEEEQHKLKKRLSKGEKRHRKRMATVAAVYTVAPHVRTPEDIVAQLGPVKDANAPAPPKPERKRVWACVAKDPEPVFNDAFQDAIRRDPVRQKKWVALVDGNPTQLAILRKLAVVYGVTLTIVLDVIHVLEYLWKAAWAFHKEGDPAAERWVHARLLEVLRGNTSEVAGGIRRSATLRGLKGARRKAVDQCAGYLLKYKQYLRYNEYLAAGLPIATGVAEGACRYLVKDRMEVTGASWSLGGAEAVLRLRSLRASDDFEAYWRFHLKQERLRNHDARYAGPLPDVIASRTAPKPSHLHLVT